MRSRLFIGNFDEGIRGDGACKGVSGPLARKCLAVSPRSAHCVTENGAALLYESSETFASYLEGLHGRRSRIIAPTGRMVRSPERPLCLRDAVMCDKTLIARISEEGMERGWALDPFVPSGWVYELSELTGLPVVGMSREAIARGIVAELNSKKRFREEAGKLGIPVPESLVVRGVDAAVKAAVEALTSRGSVMLRQSHGASGLGKVGFSIQEIRDAGHEPAAHVRKELEEGIGWTDDDILVEEHLDSGHRRIATTATVLMLIVAGSPRLVAVAETRMRDRSFVGGVMPADIPSVIRDLMVGQALRYAREAAAYGLDEGYLDMDFGLFEDGGVVAFESDCRHSGLEHLLAIRRRLCPDDAGSVVVMSDDALKVSSKASLGKVLDLMNDRTDGRRPIGWDRKTGEGTIVSIPPADGMMGYVVMAPTRSRATELCLEMEKVAERTFEI